MQDIFNTINSENIDRFMLDFYKMFHKLAESTEGIDKSNIKMSYFEWIDDGNNEITLKFIKTDHGE